MKNILLFGLFIVTLLASWLHFSSDDTVEDLANWEKLVLPGDLSEAHAFLENDCQSCHTPLIGVTRDKCVVCHANDSHVIQRQPTTFHTDIAECSSCHLEHTGRNSKITQMDHSALSVIGLEMLPAPSLAFDEGTDTAKLLNYYLSGDTTYDPLLMHPTITPQEAILNCGACHSNDDRHFDLFGKDCAQCHRTDQWSLPEFIHPPNYSPDCQQCHAAPPSHYMQHFNMISAKVAGKPHATVEQCFACHQTTSWNDIKRAGWYKHH